MSTVLVFLCKNFPQVVQAARLNIAANPQTDYAYVEGAHGLGGSDACTVLPTWFEKYVSQNGYTVTQYLRVSDRQAHVPLDDEFEVAVANALNSRICHTAFLDLLSGAVTLPPNIQ